MSAYYTKKGARLVCTLCSHYCQLKEGQVGICGVNKRVGEKIENLVYGHVAALNVDPIEKKPLYHFLPGSKSLSLGTVGCNFHCSFCQNWGISQEHHIDTSPYLAPTDIVTQAQAHGCQSISYTYNEPTIFYPYAKDIALLAHKHGLLNVFVSNGFESKELIYDMQGLIDAANIDLKSFNPRYYKQLGGRLDTILENLKLFKKLGIWIEVTSLIVPTQNDSEDELRSMATFIAKELDPFTPWHISAFHPDYKEQTLPPTSLKTLKRAFEIGKEAGLHYIYIGNTGLENSTYCSACHTKLLQRNHFSLLKKHLVNKACPTCHKPLEGVF